MKPALNLNIFKVPFSVPTLKISWGDLTVSLRCISAFPVRFAVSVRLAPLNSTSAT